PVFPVLRSCSFSSISTVDVFASVLSSCVRSFVFCYRFSSRRDNNKESSKNASANLLKHTELKKCTKNTTKEKPQKENPVKTSSVIETVC
ncbi:hypothetical protein M5D96_003136, partial [Drosophila gunungcola]